MIQGKKEYICQVIQKFVSHRFAALDPSLKHLRVEAAYSPGSGLNVKVKLFLETKLADDVQDPRQREEIQKERQKLEDTLTR